MHQPGARGKPTIVEMRIKDPTVLGDWLDFSWLMGHKMGYKSMRYAAGRASDYSVVIVGCVYLRFTDNKGTEGAVNFEAEVHTARINGIYGYLQPPHYHAKSKHKFLRAESKRRLLRMYARSMLALVAPEHHLVTHGWCDLEPQFDGLESHVALPDSDASAPDAEK